MGGTAYNVIFARAVSSKRNGLIAYIVQKLCIEYMSYKLYRYSVGNQSGDIRVRVVFRRSLIQVFHFGPLAAMFNVGALESLSDARTHIGSKDSFGCPMNIRRYRGNFVETCRWCSSTPYMLTLPGVAEALQTPECGSPLELVNPGPSKFDSLRTFASAAS